MLCNIYDSISGLQSVKEAHHNITSSPLKQLRVHNPI